MKKTIIVSLICLAIGFVSGFLIGKNQKPSFNKKGFGNQMSMMNGQKGQVRGVQTSNLRQTIGEIIKTDDSSITVKTPDGGSKIILISDSTVINKAAQVSKTDLAVGSNISITGDSNTDGSVTGKIINISSEIKPVTK